MIEQSDLTFLVEQAMAMPGRAHMRPVIEKELLHYDILFAMDKEGLLDQLTFQGGTSLRLCRGSPRFSEDLDFAGGRDPDDRQMVAIKDCVENYVGKRYALEVGIKTPAELNKEPESAELRVDKWRVTVKTQPQRRDLLSQRIKIEVANIPAYSREPRALQCRYDFLPEGYRDLLIITEKPDEVMADKLVSLVNARTRVRHRDIWDLRWLRQQGAEVNVEWIANKIRDYSIDDCPAELERMKRRLPEIVRGDDFKKEMTRFIPADVQERTLGKSKFYDFLTDEVGALLEQVGEQLKGL